MSWNPLANCDVLNNYWTHSRDLNYSSNEQEIIANGRRYDRFFFSKAVFLSLCRAIYEIALCNKAINFNDNFGWPVLLI